MANARHNRGSAWRQRSALLSLAASAVVGFGQASCGGSAEQATATASSGASGSPRSAGTGGAVSSAGGGSGGLRPYTPGPHGDLDQPCYPNATCGLGLLCTSSFVCVSDPNAAGAFGSGGGGGSAGGSFAGAPAEPSAGGAGSPPIPFCAPNAVPVQPREPLPFIVTSAFIGSGWEGNPDAMRHFDCPAGDRAPGAFGLCDGWSYVPSVVPDPFVAVGYVRMWDKLYTHPPVCIAAGAKSVEFYAKGALGGEVIVVGAEGGGEVSFELTTEWARYAFPIVGDDEAGVSGVELGFHWALLAPELNVAIPATSFQVDSIRWLESPGVAGEGGAGGEPGGPLLEAGTGGDAGGG